MCWRRWKETNQNVNVSGRLSKTTWLHGKSDLSVLLHKVVCKKQVIHFSSLLICYAVLPEYKRDLHLLACSIDTYIAVFVLLAQKLNTLCIKSFAIIIGVVIVYISYLHIISAGLYK